MLPNYKCSSQRRQPEQCGDDLREYLAGMILTITEHGPVASDNLMPRLVEIGVPWPMLCGDNAFVFFVGDFVFVWLGQSDGLREGILSLLRDRELHAWCDSQRLSFGDKPSRGAEQIPVDEVAIGRLADGWTKDFEKLTPAELRVLLPVYVGPIKVIEI